MRRDHDDERKKVARQARQVRPARLPRFVSETIGSKRLFNRQIKKLKECFASLDDDGEGSIGVQEIQVPLIGLGLV